MSDAAHLCDAISAEMLAGGRASKERAAKTEAAKLCADAIWAMRGTIAVPERDNADALDSGRVIHDGISATDYQRVQQWIAAGCPKTPDTAFTAGIARDAARLVAEALDGKANVAIGMKAAAAMLVLTSQEIRLAAGELTAQEIRTVKAVLEWRRAVILRKTEEPA